MRDTSELNRQIDNRLRVYAWVIFTLLTVALASQWSDELHAWIQSMVTQAEALGLASPPPE